MSMMGGTASVPGRGNSRLRLRSPASIAVYDTYEDAQHAVDYLADRNFPVQFLSIVGTELKSIERITGGLSWGRVLASAAMNGLVWGAMAALLFYFFVPNVSIALVFLGAIVVFVLANVLTSGISYAMTAGRRDFTSISQVVASRYSIIAAREAREATQALADVPGNLSRGGEALRRSQERRRAREEASGPTAFGSRPDEQPRFGVRLPQPGSSVSDSAPGITPGGVLGPESSTPSVPDDYDPFRRPPRRDDQGGSGGSPSSQGPADEAGSSNDD